MILVDTSIWIAFFQSKYNADIGPLDSLIYDREVCTCRPVYAEVLSGQMDAKTLKIIKNSFEAMVFTDPDWQLEKNWKKLSEMAQKAYKNSVPSCGLIDRMIILCALNGNSRLWTLDKKCRSLANFFQVPLYSAIL